MNDGEKEDLLNEEHAFQRKRTAFMCVGILFLFLMLAGVVAVTLYVVWDRYKSPDKRSPLECPSQDDVCIFTLVESIPENLTYKNGELVHLSTFAGIKQILALANETIEIASFYWTMLGTDLSVQDPSSKEGEELFNDLVLAGKERGIKIRIVQSKTDGPVNDTIYLAENAGAEVRSLDFLRLLGNGILHTKMWLIDRKHFYIGSANLDWRSFTQVKELGAVVTNCSCLAGDVGKIFDAYWYLAEPESQIPAKWPEQYNTLYNSDNPMSVQFNGSNDDAFFSSSPPAICPEGRSKDNDTIIQIINKADKFVYVAVMDYFPTTQFSSPRIFWPYIDTALRTAAFNRVQVRLLFSYWNNTSPEMFIYMWSLQDLRFKHIDIEVKLFIVPAYTDAQRQIPFSRVNHNKYMVTDTTAYIGTSNWAGDYFLYTGGIGLAVHGHEIHQQLVALFKRDWNSQYAFTLDHFNITQAK